MLTSMTAIRSVHQLCERFPSIMISYETERHLLWLMDVNPELADLACSALDALVEKDLTASLMYWIR
jgi:predicted nucleotidyltransferase